MSEGGWSTIGPGEPLRPEWRTAEFWRRLLEEARRTGGFRPGGEADARVGHGGNPALSFTPDRPRVVTLSGTGPAYDCAETATGLGLSPCREVNGVMGLAGKKARAYPDPYGDHRFQWVAKAADDGDRFGTPGCPCPTLPLSMTMTVNDESLIFGMFRNCTIERTAAPFGLLDPGVVDYVWLSTTSYTDFVTGESYRYLFVCEASGYSIRQFFACSIFGTPPDPACGDGTGPYLTTSRYYWPLAGAGNACLPLTLVTGSVFSGGDTSVHVEIHEIA